MKNEKGQPDRFETLNVAQDDILGNRTHRAYPKLVEDHRETFVSFLLNARPAILLILGILDAQLGLPKDTLASLQRSN